MSQSHAAVSRYSRPERIADAVIHGLGLNFGLVACLVLAIAVAPQGDPRLDLVLGLYGAGLLAMLSCSALYNLTSHPARKAVFRRLDHAAIFVMIAGTYTPFTVLLLNGAWGVGLLVFVWTVALGGVVVKLVWPRRFERLSVVTYLLLGWSIVVVLDPLLAAISTAGLSLLLAGGLLYSLGVVFHLWTRLPFHNAIWHALVLAAAVCHFFAVVSELPAAA